MRWAQSGNAYVFSITSPLLSPPTAPSQTLSGRLVMRYFSKCFSQFFEDFALEGIFPRGPAASPAKWPYTTSSIRRRTRQPAPSDELHPMRHSHSLDHLPLWHSTVLESHSAAGWRPTSHCTRSSIRSGREQPAPSDRASWALKHCASSSEEAFSAD